MAQFYFGSNFKMHQTPAETAAFMEDLLPLVPAPHPAQLFLIPPFTSLTTVAPLLTNHNIWLGAQNMHWAAAGAYTGEISASMLVAAGCNMVMLGHAERRQHFGEADDALRQKVALASDAGLRVLLCVGDNAAERQLGIARDIVAMQLKIALYDLSDDSLDNLMIAYEPVWSIGEAGTPADTDIVADMHECIRQTLAERYGLRALDVPILYGGSVNLTNCADYARLAYVDGLFVGRAAWSPAGFVEVMTRGVGVREYHNNEGDSN